MEDLAVSQEGILNELLNWDVKNASDPDDILSEFLRRCLEWASQYSLVIYNASLS